MPAAIAVVDVGVIMLCIALLALIYVLILLGDGAPSFPIVGNIIADDIVSPLVDLLESTVDFLLHRVVIDVGVLTWHESVTAVRNGGSLGLAMEAFLQGVIDDSSDTFREALAAVFGWALNVGTDTNLSFLQDLYYILQTRLATLEAEVQFLSGDVLNVANINQTIINYVLNAVSIPLDFLESIVQDEEQQIEGLFITLAGIDFTILPFLEGIVEHEQAEIEDIQAFLKTIPADIGDLITDIPRLRTEVLTIEGELGGLAGELEGLLTDFGTLTALLALAGAGVLALDFLLEFIKSPCTIFELTCDYEWVRPALITQLALNGT